MWTFQGLNDQCLSPGMMILLPKRYPRKRLCGCRAEVKEMHPAPGASRGDTVSLIVNGKQVTCTESDLIGVRLISG